MVERGPLDTAEGEMALLKLLPLTHNPRNILGRDTAAPLDRSSYNEACRP